MKRLKRLKCKLGIHDWQKLTYPLKTYHEWCHYAKVCRQCQKEKREWVLEH